MAKSVTNLGLLLVKLQAVYGTAETSLANTDVIETIGAAEFSSDFGASPIELVSGGFDQDAAIPGLTKYDVSGKVHVRTGGSAAAYGQIDTLLQASGMVGTTAASVKTYAFTSTRTAYKDATAWLYSGNLGTAGCLLRKASNIVFNPKWTFEAGKPVVMDFSGSGVYGGAAGTGTQPTITKLRTAAPAWMGLSTLTINGISTYKILKAEIDAGQETNLTIDVAQAYGFGQTEITNRKVKFSATVYCDLPASGDPETALLARTEGALAFAYGTAPNKATFTSTYSQITDIKKGDESGIEVWNITGQCNRNHFTLALDTTV
jgi:hypothetical protein